MEKKLYKVFYRTGNENESFTFIEADGTVVSCVLGKTQLYFETFGDLMMVLTGEC